MHSGNILVDPATSAITAILDWEEQILLPRGFSEVAPEMAKRGTYFGKDLVSHTFTQIPAFMSLQPLLEAVGDGRADCEHLIVDDYLCERSHWLEPILAPDKEDLTPVMVARMTVGILALTVGMWNESQEKDVVDAIGWLAESECGVVASV